MSRKKQLLQNCPVMRRKLVRHGTLNNIIDGVFTATREEWVSEPCNVPLFGNDEVVGKCRSCQSGWKHPHNYPL